MFFNEFTLICILSSVAGCLIRYSQTIKQGYRVKILYIINDVWIAAFLGYMACWFIFENLTVAPSYVAMISCVIGNLGARILDLITWYLQIKYKLPNLNQFDKKEKDKDDKSP